MRSLFTALAGCVAVLALGCSPQRSAGPSTSLSPTGRVSLNALAAMTRDCLQYSTGARDSAGNDLWNADYVYFTVVDTAGRVTMGADGRPLAMNLLYSQLTDFMNKHPRVAETQSQFNICAQRVVRHLKDGHVVRDDPGVTVEDFDLWAALSGDSAARAAGSSK
jgi:hypothetical protein